MCIAYRPHTSMGFPNPADMCVRRVLVLMAGAVECVGLMADWSVVCSVCVFLLGPLMLTWGMLVVVVVVL